MTLELKRDRLLTDGRVFIKSVAPEVVVAVVRGDSGLYDVDLHHGRWSCSCPAFHRCSHLEAVIAVTVPASPHRIEKGETMRPTEVTDKDGKTTVPSRPNATASTARDGSGIRHDHRPPMPPVKATDTTRSNR